MNNCLLGADIGSVKNMTDAVCVPNPACKYCGWNVKEAARRKKLPMNRGIDGLRYKRIVRKTHEKYLPAYNNNGQI